MKSKRKLTRSTTLVLCSDIRDSRERRLRVEKMRIRAKNYNKFISGK